MGGGVANAAKELMLQMTAFDVEIAVVTTSIDGRFSRKQLSERISIYYLPLGNRQGRLDQQTPLDMLRFWWACYWFTWQLIRQGKTFNVTHTFGYPGGLVSWLFSWKWPYIISLRGVDVPGYNARFAWWYGSYTWLARLVWSRAETVIVNSQWLAQLARKTYPGSQYQTIGNGVDTKVFRPVADADKYKRFTVTAGATLMGKKKGLEYLIRGFGEFHKQYPQTQLLLIGSGDQEVELKALVKALQLEAAVKLVGRRDRAWIARHLPKCHVMCLPSLAEGMSNAVLEAMACGLPLIVSDVSRELVEGNGLIIEPKEVDQIATALKNIYKSKKNRRNLGLKSRSLAKEKNWAGVANSYYTIYQTIRHD